MKILPRSLFGRFFLIIVVPILVLQLVTAYIFYQRHWENVNQYMYNSLLSELNLIIKLVDHCNNKSDLDMIIKNWQVIFSISIQKINDNEHQTKKLYIEKYQLDKIKSALEESANKKISLYSANKSGLINCDVYFHDFILHIEFSGKRIYSPTTYIFISWVISTSFLLCVIAVIFMRKQVHSIINLTNAANRFGSGADIDTFIPSGSDEIRKAGLAFIKMKKRIERNIRYRNELLTHISHDLRTPITRMKLKLALQPEDDSVNFINLNLNEMEEMLSRYLQFAKDDGNEKNQIVDLIILINQVLQIFSDNRVIFITHDLKQLNMSIKKNAIKRMIMNLLSNAAKFSVHKIVITLQDFTSDVLIKIEDDGVGIAPELYDQATEPFYKMDENQEGFGLGLAIVKNIAQAHGGEVNMGQSELYGGLSVSIVLPKLSN